MPTLAVNPGGKGGPQIQAPWGNMIGRFSSMFGGGGAGMGMSPRRRFMGAAPFPGGTPGGPDQPPIPPVAGKGLPNIQRPLPFIRREPSQWESDLSQLGFTPDWLTQNKNRREFPNAERINQITSAQSALNAGTYGPAPLRGGGGYGEGYPGDALRRLLMARMGGGGL